MDAGKDSQSADANNSVRAELVVVFRGATTGRGHEPRAGRGVGNGRARPESSI